MIGQVQKVVSVPHKTYKTVMMCIKICYYKLKMLYKTVFGAQEDGGDDDDVYVCVGSKFSQNKADVYRQKAKETRKSLRSSKFMHD